MKPNTAGRGPLARHGATGAPPPIPESILSDSLSARPPCSTLPPAEAALPVGTAVFTQDGALPVEHLCPGDGLISRDAGMVRLQGLRAGARLVQMVEVAAGTFGPGRPERDCLLPADLPLLLRDWRALSLAGRQSALLPAGRLVDGAGVRAAGEQWQRLHEPICAAPHVIYAAGLEVACGSEPLRAAA